MGETKMLFRIEKELKDQLMARAKEMDLSASQLVRKLIKIELARCEDPKPKTTPQQTKPTKPKKQGSVIPKTWRAK